MTTDSSIIFKLITEHFNSVHGHAYIQNKIAADKDRARYIMKKKPGTFKHFGQH